MIKTILFDFGGVIVNLGDPNSSSFNAQTFVKLFAISEKVVKTAWFNPWQDYKRGLISEDDFWQRYLTIAKSPRIDIKLAKQTFRTLTTVNKEVLELSTEWRNNFRLAILSNISYEWLDFSEQSFHLSHYFHPIIASYKLGIAKPEKEIYEYALKKLETQPQEIVFIDNMSKNLPVARKLGIKTILYKNPIQLKYNLSQLTKI